MGDRWMVCVVCALAGCPPPSASPTVHPDAGTEQSGICSAGVPTASPAALISGLAQPFAAAVDDSAIYWSETGGDLVKRADKLTGANPLTLASGVLVEDMVVDDLYLYLRTPDVKRISKSAPGMPLTLAARFNDLHSHGMIVDSGTVFFAGTDSTPAEVIMAVDRDGVTLTPILSGTDRVHLLGSDGIDLYYAIDSPGPPAAMQMAIPRAGGTPRMLASGDPCFDGAVDAVYLYCSGLAHPFKVRLAGGPQIALCKDDYSASHSTAVGRLALANDQLFLFAMPYSLAATDRSGTLLSVSVFASGRALAAGIDHPYTAVSDGKSLFYVENRLGSIMKLDL